MRYCLYHDTTAKEIPSDATALHLARPIKIKALKGILRKCSNVSEVSCSNSCFKRLPPKTRKVLEQQDLTVKIQSNRGRAIGIELDKMLQVIEMRKDYQSLREIESVTGIPKSTVHYLVKYADRNKVKKNGSIVYLK